MIDFQKVFQLLWTVTGEYLISALLSGTWSAFGFRHSNDITESKLNAKMEPAAAAANRVSALRVLL